MKKLPLKRLKLERLTYAGKKIRWRLRLTNPGTAGCSILLTLFITKLENSKFLNLMFH